ncbi:hypothetical protein CFP65_3278 [Kitasatospora sp. MMS16-BH015]|uniref:zinc finger domain-containing protein n=1 Tax=Kitasatospora sp. MMS16-BH015 TaxID=2018025 RepID=UPI000CA2F3E2|nr:hypothetical protein [Kitasatospora sp. MMS16-BH015]AUG78079.1 hypothetical protein CFP65_3278 [Kitasatospora sp. MMS16-BH015]
MTPNEVAALLAYVAELDPRTANSNQDEAAEQLRRWVDLLRDVPATAPDGWDAAAVVRRHVTESPYRILAVDVTRPWAAHRRSLLARHTDPTPPVDPDDVAAWQAAIRAQRDAVATGRAAPSASRELTSGAPHPAVAARIASAGSPLPAGAAEALRPYRPAKVARETAAVEGRGDELSVACPWCRAPVGEQCRRRTNRGPDRAGTWHRRATVHPSRRDAVRPTRKESAA